MKLFKLNPEFGDHDKHLIDLTIDRDCFILSLFRGKISFVIDLMYSNYKWLSFDADIGDFPKGARKTWFYLAQLRLGRIDMFIEVCHKIKIHKDRPLALAELIKAIESINRTC